MINKIPIPSYTPQPPSPNPTTYSTRTYNHDTKVYNSGTTYNQFKLEQESLWQTKTVQLERLNPSENTQRTPTKSPRKFKLDHEFLCHTKTGQLKPENPSENTPQKNTQRTPTKESYLPTKSPRKLKLDHEFLCHTKTGQLKSENPSENIPQENTQRTQRTPTKKHFHPTKSPRKLKLDHNSLWQTKTGQLKSENPSENTPQKNTQRSQRTPTKNPYHPTESPRKLKLDESLCKTKTVQLKSENPSENTPQKNTQRTPFKTPRKSSLPTLKPKDQGCKRTILKSYSQESCKKSIKKSYVPIRHSIPFNYFSKPLECFNNICRILLLLSTLYSGGFCFSSSSFTAPSFPSYPPWSHEIWLEDTGAFVVQWTPRERDIEFRITARTTGYIGFGISSKPRMDGADIVVGWVHSGKAYLQDRHGRGNYEPLVDEQRDWILVAGYENHTHTVLIMTRPYNTCDNYDHIISNDTIRLLWAYHPDDPIDPESPQPRLHYHGPIRRGVKTMYLLERWPIKWSSNPLDHTSNHHNHHRNHHHHHHHHHQTWAMVNPGVRVEEEDLYWCKVFKRPKLIEKNHIIRYEPIFSGGHKKFVHHIIVYECMDLGDDMKERFEELVESEGSRCASHLMIDYIRKCNHIVVAWAIGSQGLSLPEEAGYPLTPKGPKYYLMETHYDNPESHHFIDKSGIKITYTSVLRNYDAGVLSVGMDPNWKHLIPPRQKTVLSEGHCVKECTNAALPPSGINVFAVILHTHLLGRNVRVRHIRNGRELQPLVMDNNYDFRYQQYRTMHTPTTVLPGDHLISECIYNSWQRSTITLGGFKTRDEMCLSFLFYWPRIDLSLCHSKPSLNTVLHSLGIEELAANSNPIKIRQPIELAGKTLEWRLTNYNWTQHFNYFQHTTHSGTFNPMCWARGASIIPNIEKHDYSYPNLTSIWKPQNVCRRKTMKNKPRKPKNKGRENEDKEEDEDEREEEEVMFDDEIKSGPIQRIDVNPSVHNIDVFMPVVFEGDVGEGGDLEDEFRELEKDIEKELDGRGIVENRIGSSSAILQTRPISVWGLFFVLLLIYR